MSVYKSEFGFGETSSDHIEGLTDLEKLQLARQLMFDVLGLTGDGLGNMAVQIHWQTLDKNEHVCKMFTCRSQSTVSSRNTCDFRQGAGRSSVSLRTHSNTGETYV